MNAVDYWDTKYYEINSDSREANAVDLLKCCNFAFRGDEKILDIGCGSGHVTYALAKYIPDGIITGIDISKNMIQFAQKEFCLPNLFFEYGSASEIDVKEKYDLILSFACLHWVKDQEEVLHRVEKALKPSGQVLFLIYPKDPILFDSIDLLLANDAWKEFFSDFQNPYNFYDENNYLGFVKKTNLRVKKIEALDVRCYKDINTFKTITKSWLPHLSVIPKLLHDKFIDELADNYFRILQNKGIENISNRSIPALYVHLHKRR